MNTDKREQQNQTEEGQRNLERNESLQDAAAQVPAYGRSAGDEGDAETTPDEHRGLKKGEGETLGNP